MHHPNLVNAEHSLSFFISFSLHIYSGIVKDKNTNNNDKHKFATFETFIISALFIQFTIFHFTIQVLFYPPPQKKYD